MSFHVWNKIDFFEPSKIDSTEIVCRLESVIYLCLIFNFMYVCIYFKEITTFIQQGCIKLIKSDTKRDIYNVTKDLFQICCSFEKKNYLRILKIIFIKVLRSTLFPTLIIIIINVSWAANQHIRMITKGSCDTEDWSNDAENSALHCRNKLHFKIYSNRKQSFKMIIKFHNI